MSRGTVKYALYTVLMPCTLHITHCEMEVRVDLVEVELSQDLSPGLEEAAKLRAGTTGPEVRQDKHCY